MIWVLNGDRTSRVWASIASLAGRDGSPMSSGHACLACVEAVGASAAGLILTSDNWTLKPAYVTDSRAGEAEELQVTLGQGPGVDALARGRPTLVSDLAAPHSSRRWPTFAAEAGRLGIRAMYSLPLALGAIEVGVLDLFGDTTGHLDQGRLMDALIYADTALLLVVDAECGIPPPEAQHADGPGPVLWHAEIHQAAGMLSERLAVSPLQALVRLRAYAYHHHRPLTDVARSVVEGRLRFRPDDAHLVGEHGD
ncbi:GAF and ANTAR domain-containing protein [Mycobacterium sp. UM_CSW]|uniref:ANTAR domain-containing protein n=1 Tax=Mycobacterium sp. UM_CSW TaxID=1370119 RepID=UPI0008360709